MAVRFYADKFSLRILIETGTYYGDMVYAMRKKFKKIYSIELDNNLYLKAIEKFKVLGNIEILNGDSAELMPVILSHIDEPCLFWLDGHYSGLSTAKGRLETPILQELKSIFNHSVKGHVILIDDARCFNGKNDYPKLEELRDYVLKENKNFTFDVQDDIIRIHK